MNLKVGERLFEPAVLQLRAEYLKIDSTARRVSLQNICLVQ
jgi:hypothetical protein